MLPISFHIQTHSLWDLCLDCPLSDGEVGQLMSNGGEKLAERMAKDLDICKSIGGFVPSWHEVSTNQDEHRCHLGTSMEVHG